MKRVGWWHFEVCVPREWDIVAQGRSRSTEVFRLADAGYTVRLEVSLERMPLEKAKSVEELLALYRSSWESRLKELERKEGAKAELKHVSKDEVSVLGHKGLLWAFRVSGMPLYAALWYCERSERAVALTFTPKRAGEEELFRSMVESAKCHFQSPEERALWSLLVVSLRLPQHLQLVSAKFAATATYCLFADSEMERYLLIGYSGLVGLTMGRYKKGLRGWFEGEVVRDASKHIKQQLPKLKYREEPGGAIVVEGETFALTRKGKRLFMGRLWHDSAIDRALAAAVFYPLHSAEEARSALNDLVAQLGAR